MKTAGNIFIILFVLVTIYALRDDVLPVVYRAVNYTESVLGIESAAAPATQASTASQTVVEIQNKDTNSAGEINAPGPLQVNTPNTVVASKLSISVTDIIYLTNQERAQNGSLAALTENKILDAMAGAKAADMLAKQYFEHTSPSGVTVGTQAKIAGYDYLILGENLALGNFSNAQSILDAWMKSPGHRANILNTKYTEIGVGIIQGNYNGQTMWLAVQHFGTPRSVCPTVDIKLKAEIDMGQASVTDLKTQIDAESNKIDQTGQASYQYPGLVVDYNSMVKSYNEQVIALKGKIAIYNDQVNGFNACAAEHR